MELDNEGELVQWLAYSLYRRTPAIQRLVSHSNVVYLLDFAGWLPRKVLKMAGTHPTAPERILGEQQALRVLQRIGLPVPDVEWTQEDVSIPSRPFFTMPQLPGRVLEATWSEPTAWEGDAWRRAGAFVAQLRQVQQRDVQNIVVPPWNGFDNVRAVFEKHELLRSPFSRILDEAEALAKHDVQMFIHADYGANQIVADGTMFGVIDWEAPTTGSLLDMLARIIAMTREYGGQEHHIQWLIQGYKEHEPFTDEHMYELHIREMMNHVGVMGWKLGWYPDHDRHAREMAVRVERWASL